MMNFSHLTLALSCISFSSALRMGAANRVGICPLFGQQYPPPVHLPQDADFQALGNQIKEMLDSNLTQSPYNTTSFSIGVFTTSTDSLVYQYHHTDALVANGIVGTNRITANSIYRIGSISKLLTVYLYLIKQGTRIFGAPVTEFVQELTGYDPSLDYVVPDWDEITIGDLAGQVSGMARDYGLNDLSPMGYASSLFPADTRNAFPLLPASETPVCSYFTESLQYLQCTTQEYLHGIGTEAAVFPTAYTPAYSNAAFALLGIALARLTNVSNEALFESLIKEPLSLTGTTWSVPSKVTNNSVIPGSVATSGWNNSLGLFDAAAGAFSSTNDFATLGRAILNFTLLSGAQTRRWLKPTSFLEDGEQAVGRPWEIFRLKVDGHSVALYTKDGDWGVYHTILILIPEYGFGVSLLTAGAGGFSLRNTLPNTLIDTILPIVDSIAKKQAKKNFAGTYVTSSGNTSITVTTDRRPGLRVTQFISNGVNLLETVFALFGSDIDYRLIPNQLYSGNRTGFTGVYQNATSVRPKGTFYGTCASWVDVDDFTWDNVPLGQLVFEAGKNGKASSLQLKAFRETLYKQ